MRLVVSEVRQETKDAVSISFKNNMFFNKIKYFPGQFLTVCFIIDGVKHKRAYSFSSSPFIDKALKITVKRVQGGLISNYICDKVKVGDKIEVEKAAGGFVVVPNILIERQYVLFAGGSGITPVLSIAKSILAKEKKSKVLIVYANQNESSIIFHDEIRQVLLDHWQNFKVEHVLSNHIGALGDNYHLGLITSRLLEEVFKKYNLGYGHHHYMICGPFGFMETVKEILGEAGVGRGQIMVEVFKTPEVKLEGKDLVSEVSLKLKGETYVMNAKGNKSILEQALANNLPIPYSCRSGMCSSCKGICVSGEVKMHEGHLLDEKDVANGVVLTCISYPVSKNVEIEI